MSLSNTQMLVTTTTNEEKIISREPKVQERLSIGDDSTDAETDNGYSDTDSNRKDKASTQPTTPVESSFEAIDVKLLSKGSEGHFEGNCKRCCFFPKGRCSNGADCQFCHFDHEKRTRTNKKTKKVNKDFLLPQSRMDAQVVMHPPGLETPPGFETFSQMHCPQQGPVPAAPPAPAPLWATGPALPTAASPQMIPQNQPILEVRSQGVPLKVTLTTPFCAAVTLDKSLPAKKRVPLNYGTGDALHLNPSLPAKKRIPECLLAY